MRSLLKTFSDSADRTTEGRLFQRDGALTANKPLDLRFELVNEMKPRGSKLEVALCIY